MSEYYIHPLVSKKAITTLFSRFEHDEGSIHTLEIYSKNSQIVRLAVEPYKLTDKREIFSLSKSFTSTAIGLLYDEGKLTVEDRIIDIFPDKVPEVISDNLAEMKIKNVLSMNTGHESCVMPIMYNSDDPVKAFMSVEVKYKPGTHFAYNTGATMLLACIVEKLTGMSLLDYLTKKIFIDMEIYDIRWNPTDSGIKEGGCGIHVSCDDIAKFGLLYLNKGVWKGKRLISEDWIKQATQKVSENGDNGSSDWACGYGFQFWMMYKGGFRGDGACGQLCVVIPEKELVFAVQACLGDMQNEIDALLEFAEHMFDADDTHEFYIPAFPVLKSDRKTTGFENIYYNIDENAVGWTGAYLTYDNMKDAIGLHLSDGVNQYTISAGNGHYEESDFCAKMFQPKLTGLMSAKTPERIVISASYMINEDGCIDMHLRFRITPQDIHMIIKPDSDSIEIKLSPEWNHYEGAQLFKGKALR